MSDPTGPIAALRTSHDRLAAAAGPLTREQLAARAYPSEWSIADVLSHLGSGAEIFELIVDAGLTGGAEVGREANQPIWDWWNAKDPAAQARDSIEANERVIRKLEALTEAERAELRFHWFLGEVDTDALVRMRLNEHAVHSWDVLVALDPSATIGTESLGYLLDALAMVSRWTGKGIGRETVVRIQTGEPQRVFRLRLGERAALEAGDGEAADASLHLPAEALIRLVYGRLDPAHTPPLTVTGIELDELRRAFPGL